MRNIFKTILTMTVITTTFCFANYNNETIDEKLIGLLKRVSWDDHSTEEDILTLKALIKQGANVNFIYDENKYSFNHEPHVCDYKNDYCNNYCLDAYILDRSNDCYSFSTNSHNLYNSYTPLHIAVRGCSAYTKEIIDILVSSGANINAKNKFGMTPLIKAILHYYNTHYHGNLPQNEEEIQAYIQLQADAQLEIIKHLIELGADITLTDNEGLGPIHYASANHHLEILKVLLQKKNFDINAKINDCGGTALHLAADSTSLCSSVISTFDLLIENGADINAANKKGYTPLYITAELGYTERLKSLLSHENIKIDSQDKEGFTPLHIAVSNCDGRVVILLLLHGADYTIKNKQGYTPLETCKKMLFLMPKSDYTYSSLQKISLLIEDFQNFQKMLIDKGIKNSVNKQNIKRKFVEYLKATNKNEEQ